MSEDLQQLLRNLKLKTIAVRFEAGTPLKTLLTQLFRAEWEARQQAALAARLRRAQMPELLTLESSLQSPNRPQRASDPHLRSVGLHSQGGK